MTGSLRRRLHSHKYHFERTDHPGRRQLLVDVSTIVRADVRTGIQRVVRAILGQLVAERLAGVIVQPVFATRNHGFCKAAFTPDGRVINAASRKDGLQPVAVAQGDVFLGLDLAAHTLPLLEGRLRQWQRAGVSINIMVYDLLPLSHPAWFSRRLGRNFRRWFRVLARRADRCLCISNATAQDLARHLDAFGAKSPPAIVTTPLGADLAASFPSKGVPGDFPDLIAWVRGWRTALAVGTIEPRKGHDHLLAAFDHLWQAEPDGNIALVIVGRAGWKTESLQQQIRTHPEFGKRLMWIEQASDDVLSGLYRECAGLVGASLAEGFGLPLIEALAHGMPVLARDIPVFREVGGDLFDYFDDDAPAALGQSVRQWLANPRIPTSEMISTLPRWETSGAMILAHLGLEPDPRNAS
ncbi:MAG: glycosyltransferase family 1 protein [Novosphingobium sp.]|nr:glycosyltransferase family 1 protein [Novosphingobium sp.]